MDKYYARKIIEFRTKIAFKLLILIIVYLEY